MEDHSLCHLSAAARRPEASEDHMRAMSELRLLEGDSTPPNPNGDSASQPVAPPQFSELEAFVRTEVGLREALQVKITELERELAQLRASGAGSAEAGERTAALASAEAELA